MLEGSLMENLNRCNEKQDRQFVKRFDVEVLVAVPQNLW
jgi:hypothetical protein